LHQSPASGRTPVSVLVRALWAPSFVSPVSVPVSFLPPLYVPTTPSFVSASRCLRSPFLAGFASYAVRCFFSLRPYTTSLCAEHRLPFCISAHALSPVVCCLGRISSRNPFVSSEPRTLLSPRHASPVACLVGRCSPPSSSSVRWELSCPSFQVLASRYRLSQAGLFRRHLVLSRQNFLSLCARRARPSPVPLSSLSAAATPVLFRRCLPKSSIPSSGQQANSTLRRVLPRHTLSVLSVSLRRSLKLFG